MLDPNLLSRFNPVNCPFCAELAADLLYDASDDNDLLAMQAGLDRIADHVRCQHPSR